jgi:KDO2-lipid IV(A) lauroyltransferase
LTPEQASDFGGFIARNLGPLLPVTTIGDANLRLALPGLDATERRRILREVWDSLGRTVCELPHLGQLGQIAAAAPGPGWEITGEQYLHDVANAPGPALLLGGHIGNWEVLPAAMARFGMRLGFFYRAASSPSVEKLIQQLRRDACRREVPSFPKGAQGARQAVAHLVRGGHLGMLFDQKLNNGISVELFEHPAMTAPAAAAFGLRYKAAMLCGRVQRIGPARFRLSVEAPLELPSTGNTEADIATLTRTLNQRLEAWVRDDPGQWLWLHRRWPKHLHI